MATKRLFFAIALLLVAIRENTVEATFDSVRLNEIGVCKHETAILSCGSDVANAKHRWKMRININSPGKKIPDNPRKYEFHNRSLVIKNVRKQDAKMWYYCYYTVSVPHQYRITYIYSLKINCENFRSSVGSLLVLPCNVDIPDDDIDKVRWKFRSKKGKLIKFSSQVHRGRIAVLDSKLIIRDVRMGDAGRYTCVVSRIRHDLSKGTFSYNLNVAKLPTYKPFPRMNTTKLPTTIPVTTTRAPSTKPHTMQTTTGRYNSKAPKSETTTNGVTVSLPTKATNLKTSDKTTSTTEWPTTVAATASKPNTKLPTHSTSAKTNRKRPTERTSWTSTTRNPKHNVKSTIETNILDSNSENQRLGVVPTTSHNSAGTVASLVLLVGFCTSLLFFLIYKS